MVGVITKLAHKRGLTFRGKDLRQRGTLNVSLWQTTFAGNVRPLLWVFRQYTTFFTCISTVPAQHMHYLQFIYSSFRSQSFSLTSLLWLYCGMPVYFNRQSRLVMQKFGNFPRTHGKIQLFKLKLVKENWKPCLNWYNLTYIWSLTMSMKKGHLIYTNWCRVRIDLTSESQKRFEWNWRSNVNRDRDLSSH